MKKNLLLLGFASAITLGVNAQSSIPARKVPVNGPKTFSKMVAPSSFKGDETVNYNAPVKHNNNIPTIQAGITIGNTQYDLQTNGTPGRRIVNHGDGTLTAMWTFGELPTTFTDRGTGYAYFNGTAWSAKPTVRIENIRAGWPYEVNLANGKEMVFAHDAAASAAKTPSLLQSKNAAKGSSSFTTAASGAGFNATLQLGTIWNRAAIGTGDVIHVLSCFSENVNALGDSAIINGILRPVVYSRSTDGGATWAQSGITLPGYSSPRTTIGAADQYDIDANGTNVAAVIADDFNDLVLWKSADNGATFKRTNVDSVVYTIPKVPLNKCLKVPTNDGTTTVVVANDGTAHLVWANNTMTRTDTADLTTINFNRGTTLVYWNDKDKVKMEIPLTDADFYTGPSGNKKYDLGNAPNEDGFRYGNGGYISQPGISLGLDGKIYVIYSQAMDEDTTADAQPFRDVFMISSNDNGKHWSNPVNVSKAEGKEDVYASIAKVCDATSAHIIWQQDNEPGTALNNKDANDENNIQYAKFDLGQITAWPRVSKTYSNAAYIDSACNSIGVPSLLANKEFSVSQNYPNPFSESTTINVSLVKNSTVALTVTNVLGQTVFVDNAKNVSGNIFFTVDKATIGTGIFFYTVNVNGQVVTKKMIVE